jgi:ribosomal protein S18 acetylase RimI-like enzyme
MRIDRALVERMEASSAAVSVDNVEAATRRDPASPGAWAPLGAGALIATGHGRYVNRAIGVTVQELTPHDLDVLDAFYVGRGLDPMVELSSWAPPPTVAALRERGYGLEWFRSMFALDPREASAVASVDVHIEEVDDATVPAWLEVLAVGNAIDDPAARAVSDEQALINRTATGVVNYVGRLDGEVAGCGSLQVLDGVAWVGGAATNPAFRERGVQSALLLHRIGIAAHLGCDLVAATAVSSGGSARNLDRLGFRHVATQVVVARRG